MVARMILGALACQAASDIVCLGSPAALLRSGMRLTTTAQALCADVSAEIEGRVPGEQG